MERLKPQNAQGELYVTDTLGILAADGETCAVQLAEDPLEADGINTRAELAEVAARLRDRINTAHMLAGVTIVDPMSVWIDVTVAIEQDVVIHPFTVIRGDARIATGVEIGPFASIRTLTELGPDAKVGTFVELKAVRVGRARRSRISRTSVTQRSAKTRTSPLETSPRTSVISPSSRRKERRSAATSGTGVDNTFLAPVEIGDDTWIAPGTVITENVPPGSLAGFAPRQVIKKGGCTRSMETPTAIELALPASRGAS